MPNFGFSDFYCRNRHHVTNTCEWTPAGLYGGISIRNKVTINGNNNCHAGGILGHVTLAATNWLFGSTGCCDQGYGMYGGGYMPMMGGMYGGGMPRFFGGGYNNSGLGALTDCLLYKWMNKGGNGTDKAKKSDNKTDNDKPSNHKCEDKDASYINNLRSNLRSLRDNPSDPKAYNDLLTDIKKHIEKPEDETEEAANKKAYEDLLEEIKNKAKANGLELDKEGNAFVKKQPSATQTETSQEGVDVSGQPATPTEPPAPAPATKKPAAPEKTTPEPAAEVQIPDSVDTLNNLAPDEQKAAIDKMFEDLDKKKDLIDWLKLGKNGITNDEVRKHAKEKFHDSGMENVDNIGDLESNGKKVSEMSDDELKAYFTEVLQDVIDKSRKTIDIKEFTINSVTNSNDKYEFHITTKGGKNVTYTMIDNIDGELIFHGNNEDQQYVLLQDAEGNLYFRQYDYHEGFGQPDVK